jgi:glycosyltransferase involved in cell wall biosynthesis
MAVQNTNALVSIMMPVYNGMKTLPLAVSSVLNQTYTNWLCIIVNDGSNDGTKEYLDSLQDNRFKIIHFSENKGRPYARQAALEAAEGKYLAFLDADDFYHTEKLEKQVKLLEANPDVDLVSCGNLCYGTNFEAVSFRGVGKNKVEVYQLGGKFNVALRTSVLKLDLCKNLKFNLKLKHAQDTDFLQKYLPGRKYIAMDEILYYYSEFESVTKYKVLRTKYFGIIYHASLFTRKPVQSTFRIAKNIAKITALLIAYPFIKDRHLLNQRGAKANPLQIAEFNSILNTIKE